MKSKKLLVIIAVVAVFVALIITLGAIFTVQKVDVSYFNFEGTEVVDVSGAPTKEEILELTRGKSSVFLPKSEILQELQRDQWHALAIVRTTHNEIKVYFVQRAPAAKIVVDGVDVYIDSKGYVIDKPENITCVDISSAFDGLLLEQCEVKQQLKFASEKNNQRLQQVLEVIMSVWSCHVELGNVHAVIGQSKVFAYEGENLVVTMPTGAKIVVCAPEKDLHQKMIKAFSSYYNAEKDLQRDGVVITVREDGRVTTPKN